MTRPQQPRIDLNHGYMRFIRRNQLDRDEFNRVHEQRKSEIRERLSDSQKTIEVFEQAKRSNVYIPPHLRRQYKEIEEKRAAMAASTCRSDSDSQEETSCPLEQKQKDADDRVRRQVRRRIERSQPTVDDICISLANYSLEEKEEDLNGHENLFTLELTLKNGEQKMINVQRNTKAARLAKTISRENDFDDSQCRNLRLFIEEQLEIRLAREKKQRSRSPESSIPTSPTSSTSSSSSSIPFSV